jgi:hypothetical protein
MLEETPEVTDDSSEKMGDKLYQATRIKNLFKRTFDDDEKSFSDKLWLIVDIPLNLLRNYSVPMAETDEWDRNRGALYPILLPFAFFFLNGDLVSNDDSNINDEADRAEEISET